MSSESERNLLAELERLKIECRMLREKLAEVEKYRDYYKAEYVEAHREEWDNMIEEAVNGRSGGPMELL